jgi:IclR family transcriptional regulator, pca regulon regulatory protein
VIPNKRKSAHFRSQRNAPQGGTALPRVPADEREHVQALDRGFAVIRAFSSGAQHLTISQVSQRTQLTRAAARRYLLTLVAMGYVHHVDGVFSLSARLLDLGFAYLSSLSLPVVAQPLMENVVDRLHESCSISVLDGRDIIYIARTPAQRIMSINLVVGSRLPAHVTSMGKVLLAELSARELDAFFAVGPLKPMTKRSLCDERGLRKALEAVRQRGWAMSDSEPEDGIRSLAAPIRDRSNQAIAAINVSAHASRVSIAQLRGTHLPILQSAAAEISSLLGASVR